MSGARDGDRLKALAHAREAGDDQAECRLLVELAEEAPLFTANFERIGWWLLEAQELTETRRDLAPIELRALVRFAELLLRAGSLVEAIDVATEAEQTAREAGAADLMGRAAAVAARAQVLSAPDEAKAALSRAENAHPGMVALARAEVAAAQDRFDEALQCLEDPTGPADLLWEALVLRAEVALLAGRQGGAEGWLRQAQTLAEAEQSSHEEVVCAGLLALAAAQSGRPDAAALSFAAAIAKSREMDPVWGEGEPDGRGHLLLCLPGHSDADGAADRLIATAKARGMAGDARGFTLGTLLVVALLAATGDAEGALQVAAQVAAELEAADRMALAAPLRRLAEAVMAQPPFV